MKFLIVYVSLTLACIIVAAQGDKESEENEFVEEPAENKDDEQELRISAQKQPLAQASGIYPQSNQLYSNQYPYNGANRMPYGIQQHVSPYQGYYPQTYPRYPYGSGPVSQQLTRPNYYPSYQAPAEPLLGKKYWEYPNLKAKLGNQRQISWTAPAKPQTIQPNWYPQQQQQNYYYGRMPIQQQWQSQNTWSSNVNTVAPKPEPFDPTSEEYYQTEFNYGSVQLPSTGIELIPTELEKGKDGKVTPLSRARAWHNYHTGEPLWNLQKPIIQPKPQPVIDWNTPRPDYNPRPVIDPDQYKKDCYMNCRRRCGLGRVSQCNWNSGCGTSGARGASGCQIARPRYRTRNGPYWGAATPWNKRPVAQEIQIVDSVESSEVDVDEKPEKPCEWKWIENNWKWICKNESKDDGSGEQADSSEEESKVIDA